MFERFTGRSREVIVLAQEEARAAKQMIGTEHLLIGLLREDEGLAARALVGLGVTLEKVRASLAAKSASPDFVSPEKFDGGGGQIPFTSPAKKVLELALREALSLGHNYIGTEHILLGICRDNNGIRAAGILSDLGVDQEGVRNEIIRLLGIPRDTRGTSDEPPRWRSAKSSSTGDFEELGRTVDKLKVRVTASVKAFVDAWNVT